MPFLALVLAYVIFKIIEPARFGSPSGLFLLLQQAMIQSLLACGLYFILTMGVFDLTVGAVAMISAILGTMAGNAIGWAGMIPVSIVTALAMSMISSQLMIRLKAPPMIISVGLVLIYEALSTKLIQGKYSLPIDDEFRILGQAPWVLIPGIVLILVSMVLISRSKFGLYIHAIGSNTEIAKNTGINVTKYQTLAWLFCGLCAAIYGIVNTCYTSSVAYAQNMASATSVFKPMMACMFATAFRKYLNPMISVLIGCFFLNLVSNGLLCMGLESSLQNVVVGLAMIVIVRFSNKSRKYDVSK